MAFSGNAVTSLMRLTSGVQRNTQMGASGGRGLGTNFLELSADGGTTVSQLTQAILANLISLQDGSDFSDGTNAHTHDGRYYTETELDGGQLDNRYYTETEMSATSATPGADLVGIEAADAYWTGTDMGAALDEIKAQLGGATSTTFNFTEANVLADDDAVYAALEKLDLKHGDYASTANGEGASLIGVGDSAGNFTATNVESALAELQSNITAATAGLDSKDSCRAGSTTDVVALGTGGAYSNTGGTSARGQITWTTGPTAIDGVTLANGDRILVKDNTNGDENGIYVRTDADTWDRAEDFDADDEVTANAYTFVSEGTVNADIGYVLINNDPITIGGASGTSLNWTRFNTQGTITASNVGTDGVGVFRQKTGNDFEFRHVAPGSSKVTTTLNGQDIDIDIVEANLTLDNIGGTLSIANGGTGQTTASAAFDALSPLTTEGDLLYRNGSTNTRLPAGTAGQILAMNGGATAPEWVDNSSSALTMTNNTGVTIAANTVVELHTVAGEITEADASALGSSEATFGVTSESIADGASGSVAISGEVTIKNGAFTAGARVYLSETSGEGTPTAPSADATTIIKLGNASAAGTCVLQPEFIAVNEA